MLIRGAAEPPKPLTWNLFINNRSCVYAPRRNSARCPPIFNYGHSTQTKLICAPGAQRSHVAEIQQQHGERAAFARTSLSPFAIPWPQRKHIAAIMFSARSLFSVCVCVCECARAQIVNPIWINLAVCLCKLILTKLAFVPGLLSKVEFLSSRWKIVNFILQTVAYLHWTHQYAIKDKFN